MKKALRIIAFSMILFVGCAFALPGPLGTLESYAASKVKISKSKATITKGKTLKLKVKGSKKKVKWTRSKKKIATVNKKGKVTAKKAGKTTITAKIGKKKYRCKLTVKNPVTKLSKVSLTLNQGDTYRLKATSNGKSKTVSWKSNAPSIAAVDANGLVTAKKAGTSKITAKMNGISKSCTVKVYDPAGSKSNPIPMTTQALSTSRLNVTLTELQQGKNAVAYLNEKYRSIEEWRASQDNCRLVLMEFNVKVKSGYNIYPYSGNFLSGDVTAGVYGVFDWNTSDQLRPFKNFFIGGNDELGFLRLYDGEYGSGRICFYVPNNVTSYITTIDGLWVRFDL